MSGDLSFSDGNFPRTPCDYRFVYVDRLASSSAAAGGTPARTRSRTRLARKQVSDRVATIPGRAAARVLAGIVYPIQQARVHAGTDAALIGMPSMATSRGWRAYSPPPPTVTSPLGVE